MDENGYETGEYRAKYSEPIAIEGNVSKPFGEMYVKKFGIDLPFDRTIVVEGHPPIDDYSVLFIDKEPEFDTDGNPLFDHIIHKCSTSFHSGSMYNCTKVRQYEG